MTVTVRTNNHPRLVSNFGDLPPAIQAEFDYRDLEDAFHLPFVQYRGVWYDLGDTVGVGEIGGASADTFPGWHIYRSDSFSSGVVFKYVNDRGEPDFAGDYVVCGTYYS